MKQREIMIWKMFLLFIIILFIGGCAYTKTVKITSDPGKATIYSNGVEIGTTPLTKELSSYEENEKFEFVAKKEGYREGKITVGFKPQDKTGYHIKMERADTVSVELISFEAQSTDEGVKLAITRKPTLAYLEIIERSPNVRSVTWIISNRDKTL